jgi:hypothetical protein
MSSETITTIIHREEDRIVFPTEILGIVKKLFIIHSCRNNVIPCPWLRTADTLTNFVLPLFVSYKHAEHVYLKKLNNNSLTLN